MRDRPFVKEKPRSSGEAAATASARNAVAAVRATNAELAVERADASIRGRRGVRARVRNRAGVRNRKDATVWAQGASADAVRRARRRNARKAGAAIRSGRAHAATRHARVRSTTHVIDAWVSTAIRARCALGASRWNAAVAIQRPRDCAPRDEQRIEATAELRAVVAARLTAVGLGGHVRRLAAVVRDAA